MHKDEMHLDAEARLFAYAKKNRREMTLSEHSLWRQLKNRKLNGHKFRRQHPISSFIVDFYCPKAKLGIEIDGGYHGEVEQQQYDVGRTHELQELGIILIRFTNEQVNDNLGEVINAIKNHLSTN